uniref:BOC cell adhesion associated, onco regulated n=1 Tax=Equus asinus TaxID=9793 RepID=A0A8C4LT65_EQUAS
MMMTPRGRRPEVPFACLLLATAGCLADLNEVPQVTVQPSSTVQKLGGTVILGCVVEPPWMNTTWRLNGKELNGSNDALGVLITRGTLVITALNNHTVGRYQCVARMPAGAVASVPATVTLATFYQEANHSAWLRRSLAAHLNQQQTLPADTIFLLPGP